ncbi:MAG: hypothetical protein ABMA64_35890 [Myxococcota bacterium]
MPVPVRAKTSALLEEVAPITGGVSGPPAPLVKPEPGYYLVCWPDRWQVLEGLVVPCPSKLSLSPGANGMDADRNNRPLPEMAIAQVRTRGGVVIPHDIDGPGRSYLRKVRATGGWVSRWETLFAGSTERRVDSKGFARWMRDLVERGVVPAPAPYVLEALIEQLVVRIESWTKADPVGYAPRIAAAKSDLLVVTHELEKAQLAEAEQDEIAPELGAA